MGETSTISESKALRLARYLKEFVALRTTTVRDVSKYEAVLWFGDMPQEPECQSPAWTDDHQPGDPWLEVCKQQLPKPPDPPELILPWIDQNALKQASDEMPSLRQTTLLPDVDADCEEDEEAPLVEHHLDDHPDVRRAYERYCPTWNTWSAEYRRRERIQRVYAELFRIHTQLRKQGEIVELVMGLGLLDWQRPARGKNIPIRRHLVTARIDLHFDPANGVIRLEGAADGARLHIEDDMLEAELRPERSQYAIVNEQLDALGDDVWDKPSMFAALKSWSGALHADSTWSPELKTSTNVGGDPAISFAPALILRKRAQAGMIRIYDSLISRLNNTSNDVPPGWGGLVDDEDDHDSAEFFETSGDASRPLDLNGHETYFPLPANREQRRIVEAIGRRRGVLVQGPPGTGKSHTIANLVCHLLASGKRVLITAETGRALQVLKKHLPEEIRPLCVSLLGQGGDAFAELNTAVQGITTRFAAWSPGAYDDRIAQIDRELGGQRKTVAAIDSELRSLREDETSPHSFLSGRYQGTVSAIAARIAEEHDRYGWLQLARDAPEQPPLTREDAAEWLRIRREYSDDAIATATRRIVPSEDLPSPSAFGMAVASEQEAKDAVQRLEGLRSHAAYSPLMSMSIADRDELNSRLRNLEESRRRLERLQGDWHFEAVAAVLQGRQAVWTALRDRSVELVDKVEQLLSRLGGAAVSLPKDRDHRIVHADTMAVIAHLNGGGRWRHWGLFTPRAIKGRAYVKTDITVDGQAPATVDRLLMVCYHLELAFTISELERTWADHGGLPRNSNAQMQLIAFREHIDILNSALTYAADCMQEGEALASSNPPVPPPDWLSGQVYEWLDIIDATRVEAKYQAATDTATSCLRTLNAVRHLHDAHPVVGELIHAIESRDVAGYGHAHQRLLTIERTRHDQGFRERIEGTLNEAVPWLVEAVDDSVSDECWDRRFAEFESAWNWAVVDNWLKKRKDVTYQHELSGRRRDTDKRIGDLLSEAAALRAWTHFFQRLSTKEAAALKSWREAVRAIGKGTGRSAKMERLRREARGYMDQCREAIPVWIMPRYLVAEMLDPAPERYDVVIVDEASQLGIESLFLFYVAKKMVVVGDDQQISPYGVGIADEAVAGLQHHYLEGIPHHHALSPQSSLYGNAKIRFGQNIVLREHFRCMPEIIQFSNDLCYASNGTPLDPLRTYSANRLQPLVVRHVPEGYRTGSSQNAVNEPEADALVGQVAACIEDPRYAGHTMGVISLQGEAHAKLIEGKLLNVLEPEVIEERRLICGDAYAFQGDERNVIFLSMVAAPGETRIGALSGDSARQRFNVAASRAKDQLWLFHTATLDVLSDRCMRHRLLGYMLNPVRDVTTEDEQRFESQFERDVYQIITERGFHVRTQVCIGDLTNHHYRIDLVVEGMQGRLAVECDGDHWHGPERYEQDMARQRDLERAGWQFVRISGGDFYRDRTEAMKPVWTELSRLGIAPGGIDEATALPPTPKQNITVLDDLVTQDADLAESAAAVTSTGNGRRAAANESAAPGWLASVSLNAGSKECCGDDVHGNRPPGPASDSEAGEEKRLHSDAKAPLFPLKNDDESESPLGTGRKQVWEQPHLPDPRTASQTEVQESLLAIIEEHGPMPCHYAYKVYVRAAGFQRVTKPVKKALNRAVRALCDREHIEMADEYGTEGYADKILRAKGSPPVSLRMRGIRNLEEIPPSEIAEAMREITHKRSGSAPWNQDTMFREVLQFFELKRMTQKTQSILTVAWELYQRRPQ